jgi:hypothetical protein
LVGIDIGGELFGMTEGHVLDDEAPAESAWKLFPDRAPDQPEGVQVASVSAAISPFAPIAKRDSSKVPKPARRDRPIPAQIFPFLANNGQPDAATIEAARRFIRSHSVYVFQSIFFDIVVLLDITL